MQYVWLSPGLYGRGTATRTQAVCMALVPYLPGSVAVGVSALPTPKVPGPTVFNESRVFIREVAPCAMRGILIGAGLLLANITVNLFLTRITLV